MIVQSEYGLHILPLSRLGRDAGTTLGGRVRDELIYDPQALGLIQRIDFQSLAGFLLRRRCTYAVNPVLDPIQSRSPSATGPIRSATQNKKGAITTLT